MSSKNTASNKRRGLLALLGASALTALLLALSFPPAELGFLAWCALTPLLIALRGRRGKLGWLVVWLAGWAFGVAGFFWVRHVTWTGTILLGFYLSLYFLLFAVCVRWFSFRRGVPLGLAAPLAWTALEFVRGVFLGGLPWLLLAHTQYEALPVIQIADLTGTAGVTFWIVAVNGILADAVCCLWRLKPAIKPLRVLAAAVLALAITLFAELYGMHRLNTIVTEKGPRIALVQGNIPQDVKNLAAARETEDRLRRLDDILDKHIELTARAQSATPRPDLVIWPETMAPPAIFDSEYQTVRQYRVESLFEQQRIKEARDLLTELRRCEAWERRIIERQKESNLLIGSQAHSVDRDARRIDAFNSARLLRRGQAGPEGKRYDKIHLVPFGEYVPLKALIGWAVAPFVPYEGGLEPGKDQMLFEVKGWHFAPTICFEDAFPELVADFGRRGEKMDFIVNVTNEGWFKDGAELDQHIAIAVFRAIECRAGFVRAANTGISAFISPTGRILSKLVVDGKDREVAGVLHGSATTTAGRSPYLAVGELFGKLCVVAWVLLALALAPADIKPWIRRRSPGG